MGRRYLIIIGALALLVGVIVFFQKRGPEELSREELPLVVEEPPAQLEPPPGPPPIVSPVPREPVPPPPLVTEPEPPPEPLPALDESDPALVESLAGVTDQEWISQSLVAQDVARKIVVTVDNLPRQKVAQQLRPIRPVPGRFLVDGPEDARVISPDNYSRYSAFVNIVDATDANQIAAMYQRYYPLFQQAYRELGYPTQSFNARVIEVIDDLLAAPAPAQPIRLERPHVLYTYADEDLEAASAGQKVLMRMGPSNAAVVKAKLREIRAAIIE